MLSKLPENAVYLQALHPMVGFLILFIKYLTVYYLVYAANFTVSVFDQKFRGCYLSFCFTAQMLHHHQDL